LGLLVVTTNVAKVAKDQLFKDDHTKDYTKSIFYGKPYKRLYKISHRPIPQKASSLGLNLTLK
jgi:hypothetical protein